MKEYLLNQEQDFMNELDKVFQINSKIKKKIIFLDSESKSDKQKQIQNLENFKEEINKALISKIDLLSAHLLEKVELFSEETLRKKREALGKEKREEVQDNQKRPEFFLSFVKQ